MKKIALGMILMAITSTAISGNDVWQTPFKEKLQEARQGNNNAQFDVGSMYQNGRGTSPDRNKAIEWYKKAAAQDNQKAVTRLNSTIKFKTKSIMRSFSNDGSFKVAYRNLVTDATEIAAVEDTEEADEIGGEDVNTAAYTVKTGWGKEHLLECQMKDSGTVSCQKDRTHSFLLISPHTVGSGN
ncbi:MAG: tetratricopeptide repeat protein [Pseudomonadota bacterium]